MDDAQLMDVLREMQAESERVTGEEQLQRDESTDYVRAKIATIRRNVRRFQAQHAAGESDAANGAADGAADASPRVAEGAAATNRPRVPPPRTPRAPPGTPRAPLPSDGSRRSCFLARRAGTAHDVVAPPHAPRRALTRGFRVG